jgi:hypothetical protein
VSFTRVNHPRQSPASITRVNHPRQSPASITRANHPRQSPASITRVNHPHQSPASITCVNHPMNLAEEQEEQDNWYSKGLMELYIYPSHFISFKHRYNSKVSSKARNILVV